MASETAHTAAAGFTHKQQARRQLSRIVPAIPHRLSRAPPPAARPITPEGSSKSPVPQPEPQPDIKAPEEPQSAGQSQPQAAALANTPLTPESRISAADKSETDDSAPLAHSPPTSQDGQGGSAANARDNNFNGHIPDTSAETSANRSEPKPAVNGHRRKLTIPAHLPPPFYPSNKAGTFTPPVQDTDAPKAGLHKHQLSAGAVIFQSANGSPATPATPQEADQDVHQQHQDLPRLPPDLPNQNHDPLVSAHSQHSADTGAPWVFPPYAAVPSEHVCNNGADHQSPQFLHGPQTQPEMYQGQYPLADANPVPNGTGTSHSQSPRITLVAELNSTSEHSEEHHAVHYQNGTAHLEQSPFELAAYLSTQFANPEFADFVLQIRSPESALVSIPVHGIVVARSPVIAEAARRSSASTHRSRDARRLIEVLALDPFTTRQSLEEAVRVLYGAPLVSPQSFLFGLRPYVYENSPAPSFSEARQRMQQVLSYIAAAKTLQIPSMQAHGVEIARMLLRWDTVDQVFRYGLQASQAKAKAAETDHFFIVTLLNYAVEFIAYTFPVDFKLFTTAPELHDTPRLPVLLESRPPSHNPRLSKIRFGDAPPEDDLSPSHLVTVLSTILLSLPPALLECLFNHRATANQVGWTGAVKHLKIIVAERENRRQKTLRGQLRPAQDGLVPAALLDNMLTEEHVEPSPLHPSGYRLAARRLASET